MAEPRKPTVFEIPKGTPHSHCRGCGKMIFWITTPKKKVQMPVDPDGLSHFSSCPMANNFRKGVER